MFAVLIYQVSDLYQVEFGNGSLHARCSLDGLGLNPAIHQAGNIGSPVLGREIQLDGLPLHEFEHHLRVELAAGDVTVDLEILAFASFADRNVVDRDFDAIDRHIGPVAVAEYCDITFLG